MILILGSLGWRVWLGGGCLGRGDISLSTTSTTITTTTTTNSTYNGLLLARPPFLMTEEYGEPALIFLITFPFFGAIVNKLIF